MNRFPIMWKTLLVIGFLIFLAVQSGHTIIPPRPGTGLTLPLTQAERDALQLGFAGPVPRRFIVVDREGNEKPSVEGFYPVPVLLGDHPGESGTYSQPEFQELLFDGPNPTGTMKDFYEQNSYDLFTLDGTVHGWFTLPESRGYYEGGNTGFGPWPNNAGSFVYDLCVVSDTDVDFSLYDNDGPDGIPNSGDDNGYVDAIFAVHTGDGGECGGSRIWSHRSSITNMGGPSGGYETDDASANGGFIHVNDYIIMPEMSCGGNGLIEIGVYCHEFGHSLGLPDLYDTDGSSEGIGQWGLMGSGSWGGNGGQPELPTHMGAWSKERLGWVTPIELSSNTDIVQIPQVEDSPTVIKLWHQGDYSGLEYFLVENRQKVGFDASLLMPGILIWHIDNSRSNNRDENHKLVDVEEADGTNGLDHAGNRGDAGDPWPGSTGNTTFDWFSQPDNFSYSGSRTEVSVTKIGEADSLMDVKFTISSAVIDSLAWNLDDSEGDGDGIWDVGEEVAMNFVVRNDSPTPAESLWAVVSSEDATVQFVTDSVFLGTLEGEFMIGNESDPFAITTTPDAPVHRSELVLTLHGLDHFLWETSLQVMIGHPSVLIVDDAESDSDYLKYYTATLDTLVVPYVTRTVSTQGSPADSLEPFELVIWFTGQEQNNILDSLDLTALRDHVERGGQLLLSGQNIAEDLHNSGESFLSETLKADWGGTNLLPFAYGLRGDPVTDSVFVIITAGTNGANNQTSRDILLPLSGGSPIAVYDSTNWEDVAGVRVQFTEYGSKLIFLGFGFEAVNRPSSAHEQVTRVEFMKRMLDWLSSPVGIDGGDEPTADMPKILGLGQNYPNPFNPTTTIVFDIPDGGETETTNLVIYNLRGEQVRVLIDDRVEPGRYEVVWDGRDEAGERVSSGVYFYKLTHGEKSVTRKMLVVK